MAKKTEKKIEKQTNNELNIVENAISDINFRLDTIISCITDISLNVKNKENDEINNLINYKRGCEMLMKHYSNLVEMNNNFDRQAYDSAMEKLNRISKIDHKIISEIETIIIERYVEKDMV